MMNKIYDFELVEELRKKQSKLILNYVIFVICFLVALLLTFALIDSNLLLTILFALLTFSFSLFSIVFWKVKYGILKEYSAFLDNIETGKREDFVGIFARKENADSHLGCFDTYVFTYLDKETAFFARIEHSVEFSVGGKYHLEHVGNYVYQWEVID